MAIEIVDLPTKNRGFSTSLCKSLPEGMLIYVDKTNTGWWF